MNKDKPLLGTDYPKSPDSKEVFGTDYNKKLVEKSKSKFKFEIAGGDTAKKSGPDYGETKSDSPLSKGPKPKDLRNKI